MTMRTRRREPASWFLVAIALVAVIGAAVVALLNLGADALR